jgi:hypothetical protein
MTIYGIVLAAQATPPRRPAAGAGPPGAGFRFPPASRRASVPLPKSCPEGGLQA